MTGGASLPPRQDSPAERRVTQAINRLDGALLEISRREHRFSWLRLPGSGDDSWLPVAAYYPANRAIVIAHEDTAVRAHLVEAAGGHGLYTAAVDPAEIPDDAEQGARVLQARLEHHGWVPRPATGPASATPPSEPAHIAAGARSLSPLHTTTSPLRAGAAAHRTGGFPLGTASSPARTATSPALATPSPRRPASPEAAQETAEARRFGMIVGILLIVVALAEAFVAVSLAAADGEIVLGIGLVLDACARVAGTLTSRRDQVASTLILGSPAVIARARDGAEGVRPVARVATAAVVLVLLGVLLAILGV